MLLDPFTAFATIKSATSLLSEGIKTGKKLHDMAKEVTRWANAESSLDLHASNKGKGGVMSKLGLSSVEEDAMASYFHKKQLREKRDELRQIFLLYADNGLKEWELLQAEIGRIRAQKKAELRRKIAERKKIQKIIGLSVLAFLILVCVLIYGRIFKVI